MFVMNTSIYCLGCYYDLRGLPSNRCPECGRPFDPKNAETFTRVPHSTRIRDLIGRIAKGIENALTPAESVEDGLSKLQTTTSALANEILWLERSNYRLRLHLDLVLDVLINHKFMNESDLTDVRRQIQEGEAGWQFVNDEMQAEGNVRNP